MSGKTAWITGASSGIGEGLAKEWLARGGRCVLSGRNVAALEAVAANAPDRCLVLPFESTDYAAIPAMVDKAVAFAGNVDVLVNNAGISQRSLAIDTDMSVYRKIVDVDLLAPIALTQALLPHLLARGSGGVVMISSVAGKAGVPSTALSAMRIRCAAKLRGRGSRCWSWHRDQCAPMSRAMHWRLTDRCAVSAMRRSTMDLILQMSPRRSGMPWMPGSARLSLLKVWKQLSP
jgi:NAD(P)-dependent dehydrogenase (short-subunit alcohol dehydrogenase family)